MSSEHRSSKSDQVPRVPRIPRGYQPSQLPLPTMNSRRPGLTMWALDPPSWLLYGPIIDRVSSRFAGERKLRFKRMDDQPINISSRRSQTVGSTPQREAVMAS